MLLAENISRIIKVEDWVGMLRVGCSSILCSKISSNIFTEHNNFKWLDTWIKEQSYLGTFLSRFLDEEFYYRRTNKFQKIGAQHVRAARKIHNSQQIVKKWSRTDNAKIKSKF